MNTNIFKVEFLVAIIYVIIAHYYIGSTVFEQAHLYVYALIMLV